MAEESRHFLTNDWDEEKGRGGWSRPDGNATCVVNISSGWEERLCRSNAPTRWAACLLRSLNYSPFYLIKQSTTYLLLVLAPSDTRRRTHITTLLDVGVLPVVDTVVEVGQELGALMVIGQSRRGKDHGQTGRATPEAPSLK